MQGKYNHKDIETKWRKVWSNANTHKTAQNKGKDKFYILDMFPYPSGDGLHMGHTESYTASDIFYRYKRMKGFDVLHPQGFDSFGLPAENYAIKTGIHPKETTKTNSDNYLQQMRMLGLGHDLDHLVYTSSPEYYRWTQWLFGKFFENGLVEQKTDTINWCSSCNTGLANEQVEQGKCERCKTEIEQREVKGWFFKITDFAQDLIDGLDDVDWPETTKKNQKNWIGRSEGAEIDFVVSGTDKKIKVFTTRPDTLFGATYMVLAPEHPLVEELKDKIENYDDVAEYVQKSKNKTEMERMEAKEKTGLELKGIKAVNPAREKAGMDGVEIPIFIADYVLSGYGTGAIMAVPAHDERDFEFAEKFGVKVKTVIEPKIFIADTPNELNQKRYDLVMSCKKSYTDPGPLIHSGPFDGLDSEEAKAKITEYVGGAMTVNYRLRDWSISRQRYWGCPIPIVYSPSGEAKYVGDENLPWTLPEDVDFVPTGTAPLAHSDELKTRTEKLFGEGWTPEVDTMDTFVDSSWYFLRYPDTENEDAFCSEEKLKHWLPVDLYIGGAEHTYMHLLYARFFTHAMHKMGLIDFKEPFWKLRHQGMVLDKNGVKMSKSKGNIVNPNDMVEKFGADAVRLNMMFAGPLEDDVMWNEDNIVGVYRFLERVWKMQDMLIDTTPPEVEKQLHKTIKKVGDDIEELKYNTAISSMMILARTIEKEKGISKDDFASFLRILSPFAPFITQELWDTVGNDGFIIEADFPVFDMAKTVEDTITIVAQVNGKVRAEFKIAKDATEKQLQERALDLYDVRKWTDGKNIKKVIVVTNKIVNLVI